LFLCPYLNGTQAYFIRQAWINTEGGNFLSEGWWKFTDGCIATPESLALTFVKQFHGGPHPGQTALKTTLAQHFCVPRLSSLSKTVCESCSLCARNNLQYLLVFVYTFSVWIKAFLTRLRKPKKWPGGLLKKIIPRLGISVSIGSDNGPVFVTEVIQLMAKRLKIT
jgi:hypothetical protein